jgi:hypothetical protein
MTHPFRLSILPALRPLAAAALLLAGAAGLRAAGLPPGTVRTFDFDSGVPALAVGTPVPFRQEVDGLEARFRGPAGSHGYAIQSLATMPHGLPGFDGRFLAPARLDPGPLLIEFGQAVRRVTLAFATPDSNQAEAATAIRLTAFAGAAEVGSVQARGTYGTGTFPVGSVTFDSAGVPFDSVVVAVPPQRLGVTACLVDQVVVTLP